MPFKVPRLEQELTLSIIYLFLSQQCFLVRERTARPPATLLAPSSRGSLRREAGASQPRCLGRQEPRRVPAASLFFPAPALCWAGPAPAAWAAKPPAGRGDAGFRSSWVFTRGIGQLSASRAPPQLGVRSRSGSASGSLHSGAGRPGRALSQQLVTTAAQLRP